MELDAKVAMLAGTILATIKVAKEWHVQIRKISAAEARRTRKPKAISQATPSHETATMARPSQPGRLEIALVLINMVCTVLGYGILGWYFLSPPRAVSTHDLALLVMAGAMFTSGLMSSRLGP